MVILIMIASMGQSGFPEHPNADVVNGRKIAKFLLLFVILSILSLLLLLLLLLLSLLIPILVLITSTQRL